MITFILNLYIYIYLYMYLYIKLLIYIYLSIKLFILKPVQHHTNPSPTAAPHCSRVFGREVWQIGILTDPADSVGSNHFLLFAISVTLGNDFASLYLSFFLINAEGKKPC